MKKPSQFSAKREQGFTRIDLLAMLVMLLLCGVVVAGANRSKTGSQATQCLTAKHRLATAWSLFTLDNDGAAPGSIHGALAQNPVANATTRPWAQGWLDWGSRTDNTNFSILISPSYSSIAQYIAEDRKIFRCPSDVYISSIQRQLGWTERVRSVSHSVHVGSGNGGPGDGPWNSAYIKVRKLSEMVNPNPAETYIFLDEHPDSMNDPAFFSPFGDTTSGSWSHVDGPGNFHDGAGAITFADGRAEIRSWVDQRIRQLPVTTASLGTMNPAANDARWLYLRTPRRQGF